MKEFEGFGAFAKHLARLAVIAPEVSKHITERSAEEIRDTAVGMIGQYQDAIGPFVKWEQLADSTEDEKSRAGYSLDAPLLRTGDMQKSIEQKTVGSEANIGSDDVKMIYHELGTERIPPRPVLGPAAIHSEERIKRIAGTTAVAWLSGRGWVRPRKLPVTKKP